MPDINDFLPRSGSPSLSAFEQHEKKFAQFQVEVGQAVQELVGRLGAIDARVTVALQGRDQQAVYIALEYLKLDPEKLDNVAFALATETVARELRGQTKEDQSLHDSSGSQAGDVLQTSAGSQDVAQASVQDASADDGSLDRASN